MSVPKKETLSRAARFDLIEKRIAALKKTLAKGASACAQLGGRDNRLMNRRKLNYRGRRG